MHAVRAVLLLFIICRLLIHSVTQLPASPTRAPEVTKQITFCVREFGMVS